MIDAEVSFEIIDFTPVSLEVKEQLHGEGTTIQIKVGTAYITLSVKCDEPVKVKALECSSEFLPISLALK